ncbi:hypothetical protein HY417_02320 [Candidatus Kaiserbacteria bacterium]|nr:hypothetical protein [Candidatus Kaiserbacteria bacterium]
MAEQPGAPRPPFPPEEPKGNLASNILAIVGFIILIVVVIWGLVNLASLSRGWFSSIFPGRGAAIEVSAPESAMSGTPFTLSWKYDEPVTGTYALLYPCTSGLSFQTPGARGSVGIPCGAAFTLSGTENKTSLTPYLSGTTDRDVPLSVIFMPTATGTRAEGSTSVRISPLPSATPTPPSTGSGQATPPVQPTSPAPTPAPTQSPTPKPSPAPASPADLSVRIISVSVDAGGNGTAIFDIANVGGSVSGVYSFTASLPTQSGYTYASPVQSSLAPQAHIVSTLRFSQALSGVFTVSITTADANGANNYASQTVNAPQLNYYNSYNTYPYGGTYDYGYQYPQYQSGMYPNQYTYPVNQYMPYQQQNYYSTYYPYAY